MNFFKLARMYPDATTEAEAISVAEADIASLDAQISELTSKRELLAQLVMPSLANNTPPRSQQIALVQPTMPRIIQSRAHILNRPQRTRANGITEFLYTNDAYSKISRKLDIGTHDGSDSYHVWLSRPEIDIVYNTKKKNVAA